MQVLRSKWLAVLLGCVLVSPVAAHADQPGGTAASSSSKKKQLDPSETVCRNEEVLGSRLSSRRICMTRSEWAEKRRQDRALVEQSQIRGCASQTGC